MNLDALHDAELLLVCDLIQCVFTGATASGNPVPCGSRQGDRGGKRRAVELVDHNAWPQIVKVDDVVNSAGQGEREGLLALAGFVGLNRVEGLLTAVGTVLVGRVDLRVAVVVVPVGTGVLVNGLNSGVPGTSTAESPTTWFQFRSMRKSLGSDTKSVKPKASVSSS